jgi:CBS domain-containing protein
MQVSDAMNSDVRVCYPDEPLLEAAARLVTSGGDSFVVVRSPEKPDLVGMLTLRDIANALGVDTAPFEALAVSNVMSRAVHACRVEDKVWEVAEAMQTHGVRHLPVLDDRGRVEGMISLTDLANVAVADGPGAIGVLTPKAICEVLVAAARKR